MLGTAVLMTMTALVACKPEQPDDTSAPVDVAWTEAFDTSQAGALSGVWGSGPDDVFMVGGDDVQGEVYHFDGSTWSPMDVPSGIPLLVWAYGFGPQDVYAVGLDGGMVHYDGTAWSIIDTGTTQELWGVFGTSGSDLWIVGGDPDIGGDCGDEAVKGEKTCIWHYGGAGPLTPVTLPPGNNDRSTTSLFKVWGIGSKLFIVGQHGLVLQYVGSAWERISAGAEANDDFVSLWGPAEDDIVAVGGRGNAKIATYDGSVWDTQAPAGVGGFNAISYIEPDLAVLGGTYGWVGTFEPSTGTLTREDVLGTRDIHAIWGDGQGRYYAVGGYFLPPYEGVAYVRSSVGD